MDTVKQVTTLSAQGAIFPVSFFSSVGVATIKILITQPACVAYSRAVRSLGPFHGAIAVPSVTRCRCRCCRGHRCAGGALRYRQRHLVNGREAARSGEWAQHFTNASCLQQSHFVWKKRNCYGKISAVFTRYLPNRNGRKLTGRDSLSH